MTIIITKKIQNKGNCVIDNHNIKEGKEYNILYKGNKNQIEKYLKLKGV